LNKKIEQKGWNENLSNNTKYNIKVPNKIALGLCKSIKSGQNVVCTNSWLQNNLAKNYLPTI
jgi:hypothetical protein